MLYVIPVKIFEELDKISNIMSSKLKEFEVKISKEVLKQTHFPEVRFEVAKRTHEITLLTEGMLKLDKTLMGVIELEPKEVLVQGLRKELCRKLAEILHDEFIFVASKDQSQLANVEINEKGNKVQGGRAAFGDFGEKFERLRFKFVGLKRSIEYIQDFLNV